MHRRTSITVKYRRWPRAVCTRCCKFVRSNQGTCINQRPIVRRGERVAAGEPLADSSSTDEGELALGQSVLVRLHVLGRLQLRGRDHHLRGRGRATTSSPRSTSRSTRSRRATPSSGPEEITRDIPNVGEECLRDLDEDGIIRIGAEVQPRRHPGRQDHAQGRDRADGGREAAARDLR